jgi:hypothetical protein
MILTILYYEMLNFLGFTHGISFLCINRNVQETDL